MDIFRIQKDSDNEYVRDSYNQITSQRKNLLLIKPDAVVFVQRNGEEYIKLFSYKVIMTFSQINLKPYLESASDGLILIKEHSELNTQIQLSGVETYALLKFDENNYFESVDFSTQPEGIFTVQTTAKTIIVIKITDFVKCRNIERFEFFCALVSNIKK